MRYRSSKRAQRSHAPSRTARGEAREIALSMLGSALLHWWEVPEAAGQYMTLDGSTSDIFTLKDRVGTAHLAPVAAALPLHHMDGGPNDIPRLTYYTDQPACGLSAPLTIAAANHVGFYVLAKLGAIEEAYTFQVNGVGEEDFVRKQTPLSARGHQRFMGGSGFALEFPLPSDGYHLFSFLPTLNGPLPGIYVDGVRTCIPSGTADAIAKVSFSVGNVNNLADGEFCLAFAVDLSTNEAARDRIAKDYVILRTGGEITIV